MLNRILGYLFYPLISPLYLLLRIALYKAAKKAEYLSNEEEVAMVKYEAGEVPVTVRTTRETELDFIKYRSPSYIAPMTWGVAHELAAMLLKSNRPQPITEDILVRIFTETAGANRTHWDKNRQCYVVDFSCFRTGVWDGYYQDVLEFEFNVERCHYAVIDRAGNRYTPESANWNSCLLHVICAYTLFIPLAAHNWIHFALPDSISTAVYKKLPKNTFLYHLLAPHTRFTNRINHQAVWVQKSADNYPDLRHKLVPWKSFPKDGKKFREDILYNTGKKYENFIEHFSMPYHLDTSIPYFAYLKAYFDVIESFIKKLTPYIEDDTYAIIADYLESFFVGFKELDKTQVLSVFIWQVGVWHLTDHSTYVPYAREYGFTEIRKPITETISLKDISGYNRYRFCNFLNIFGRFNPNPKLDQSLLNIDAYGFSIDSQPYAIAKAFRNDLLELDRRLKDDGNAFVSVEQHIQSISH
jgi:hypothetical protein